jgi:hypothetical protein
MRPALGSIRAVRQPAKARNARGGDDSIMIGATRELLEQRA